jgi:hypothetical protein
MCFAGSKGPRKIGLCMEIGTPSIFMLVPLKKTAEI